MMLILIYRPHILHSLLLQGKKIRLIGQDKLCSECNYRFSALTTCNYFIMFNKGIVLSIVKHCCDETIHEMLLFLSFS